jgi:hypothetical protein
LRRALKAFRLWRRFRRLRKAWKIIRLTDALMADKSSQKRQAFWREFIYHHDFRRFACQKFNRELLG